MNSIITNYQTPAFIISVVSLTLIVPILLMYKQYFRSLDFLQMSFIFAAAMYKTAFSSQLYVSMVNFSRNLLTFCQSGDVVCTLGFQLSFGVILFGFILLVRIFVSIKRCTGNPNLQFQPTYASLKGFFRWIYLPLVYYSTPFLIKAVDTYMNSNKTITDSFIASAVILGFCALYPVFQLIGYKCIQTEDPIFSIWNKWLQFFGYMRLLATGVLLGMYTQYSDVIYLHCIMIALILYSVIATWKGDFYYPVGERIAFGLGEAAFLANFYIFKYRPQAIEKYDIDFFLLLFVISLDTFTYLIRSVLIACYGIRDQKVNIELNESLDKLQVKKRGNKFDPLDAIESKDISPRRKK